MRDLQGKVALVTGGGSGIGKLTAGKLAERGADVVIADVADSAAWDSALSEALGDGPIHVAHLNAGIATGQNDIDSLTDEEYRRVMGVNVDGVVFGTRAVARRMPDGGAIVATASLGGLVPMPSDPIYSLGKHAVVAFVRSMAPLLHPRGITINALCPGFVDTPLVTEEFRSFIAQMNVPMLDPDVVAGTVVKILDEGRTGEAWFVQPGREPTPYEFRGVPGPRPEH